MQKLQKTIFSAVILSETMHIFCCVLPVLFSVFSLLAGIGMIGAMPAVLTQFHEIMHGYEVPMIVSSAVILGLGWTLYTISKRMNCADTGCCHPPCEPRKDKAYTILKIATGLFIINLTVYMTFHRAYDKAHPIGEAGIHAGHDHHHHNHHHDN